MLPEANRLVANDQTRRIIRSSRGDARIEIQFSEQAPQQVTRRLGGRIEGNLLYVGEFAAIGDDDAVNRPVGGYRNAVNDPVNWIAQKLKTRDQRNIQIAAGELSAKRRGMIENDLPFPTFNERTRVEVFNAADSKRIQAQASSASVGGGADPFFR